MNSEFIRHIRALSNDEIRNTRRVLCSEDAIRCKHLPGLRSLLTPGEETIFIFPQDQLVRGKRGYAKARILSSLEGAKVIASPSDEIAALLNGKYGEVVVMGSITLGTQSEVVNGSFPALRVDISTTTNSDTDKHFIRLIHDLSAESSCWWRAVACIFVKDRLPIIDASSQNHWCTNCQDLDVSPDEVRDGLNEVLDFCNGTHSERIAVAKAAKTGVSLEESDLYVSTSPCEECAKVLVETGVKRVVFDGEYYDREGVRLLVSKGVVVEKVEKQF